MCVTIAWEGNMAVVSYVHNHKTELFRVVVNGKTRARVESLEVLPGGSVICHGPSREDRPGKLSVVLVPLVTPAPAHGWTEEAAQEWMTARYGREVVLGSIL